MKKIFIGAFSLMMLASCSNSSQFKVEGKLDGAKDKTLYLELVGMNETSLLDSAKIGAQGEFKFASNKPKFKPEFYRLRIDNQVVNFSVDSTETIKIMADYAKLPFEYTVEGSANSEKIKQLNLSAGKVKVKMDSLIAERRSGKLNETQFAALMDSSLTNHKAMAKRIIFEDLRSAPAYYALFQKVYNYLIFDPYAKEDNKLYCAVATSMDFFNPEAPRTKHMKQFATDALQVVRSQKRQERTYDEVVSNSVQSVAEVKSNFEIELPNNKGKKVALSSTMGKVVILNFTAYETKESPALNMVLNDLYSSYSAKGLEIYQVSVDTDEHFWKVSANNVPWIAVRDESSIYSKYLSMYNVQQLPTIFVLDRQGEIVERVQKVSDLTNIVKKYL
ncbi:MAG: thioredoxin-like domain-containing protein [Bacteroidales bacterium]